MDLNTAYQIASICSSIACVLLVGAMIPLLFFALKHLSKLNEGMEQLRISVKDIGSESHDFIRALTSISQQVDGQMHHVEEVMHTVRGWTDRVDRVVDNVGNVVESPLMNIVRNAEVIQRGASAFMTSLRKHQNAKSQSTRKDY